MAEVTKHVFIPAAQGRGETRTLPSPFQLYFDGNMNLRLEGWNSLTNAALQLSGLFLREDGTMNWFSKSLALTSDRLRAAVDIPMERGYLSNLVCVAVGAAPRIGETFARVTVTLGLTGSTIVLGALLQGYVTAAQGIAWPIAPMRSSLDGPGVMRTLEPASPALGAEILTVQPTNTRWRLISLFAELTSSAAAVTRVPGLAIQSGSAVRYATLPTDGSQGASVVLGYTWGIGLGVSTPAGYGNFSGPLPDGVMLNQSGSVGTLTQGLAAGDQWNPGSFLIEEWLEVN